MKLFHLIKLFVLFLKALYDMLMTKADIWFCCLATTMRYDVSMSVHLCLGTAQQEQVFSV